MNSKLWSTALLAVCACGSSGGGGVPQAPLANDPAFAVGGPVSYVLAGDALTPSTAALTLMVASPGDRPDIAGVDVWLDGEKVSSLVGSGRTFQGPLQVDGLAIGEHELILAEPGASEGFAFYPFTRGHAIYVLTTTDWDDPDNDDRSLRLQEQLHESHPSLILTHFVGPYTFTDPSVSEDRRTLLADWVKGMRDDHGDEIGLHIHTWCSFIESAGVPCLTSPSVANADGDPTGYSVVLSSYSEQDFVTILEHADELFLARGLGKPTSFRAGGWTAEANILSALATAGYVADTSAVNWARIEEWLPYEAQGTMLYSWLMSHWTPQGDTNQPYYPSVADVNVAGSPSIAILEVPDNGALVDYVSGEEMIQIFQANWPGGALPEPRQLSIGYHPPNFHTDFQYKPRMDMILSHLDGLLASDGNGPVVYARLSDMAVVWPAP